MASLRIQNVSKSYRVYPNPLARLTEMATFGRLRRHAVHEALTDISFELEPGKTLGIIGNNGAGKSTLLRLLGGIASPTTGSVQVPGRVSALMDLTAGFHPDFSGRDNIAIKCALLGMSREEEEEKFERIVAFSELAHCIDDPVRTYSSGMRIRLGFSVAIMVEPDVILIDEVLAVGDQHFQDKCIRRIRGLQDDGKTIVIVSHHMKPLRGLCDSVLWLEKGRVVHFGPGAQVVDEYIDSVRQAVGAKAPVQNASLRSGSREAWIESVRILDGAGVECTRFATGNALNVEIRYDTKQAIPAPTFLATFRRNDGVEIYSCSSRVDGTSPARIEGPGRAVLEIPRLDLLSGSYEITVEIQDADGIRPYDAHYHLYTFQVRNGEEDSGLSRIEHTFRFEDAE